MSRDVGMPAARDIVPQWKRSQMMRAVRQAGTPVERAVQRMVQKLGVRYRRNHAGLPGRPDLANKTKRWAIFVHGCFWHGHRSCTKTRGGKGGRIPARNAAFWQAKIAANRARDRRKLRALLAQGIRVLTIWECELRHLARVQRRVQRFLDAAAERGRM